MCESDTKVNEKTALILLKLNKIKEKLEEKPNKEGIHEFAHDLIDFIHSLNGGITPRFYDELASVFDDILMGIPRNPNDNDNGFKPNIVRNEFIGQVVERRGDKPNEEAYTRSNNQIVNYAFDTIIKELRSNWRIPQPTIYEQMIEIFRSRPSNDITLEMLTPLFGGSSNPEHATMTKISKLNNKLELFGLRVVRVNKGYRIISLRVAW